MGRHVKSQWDFGELFPPETARRVLTVSELTAQIRRLLEERIGQVWVSGEVSNLRAQASGHIYFTLKDAAAQLNCVLFRNEPVAHRELLADGQKLLVHGDITVYEARGQYQLIVRALELHGLGALQAAFERLKQKLAAEGLFASERKRPLPKFARRIGLVTSPAGAAIRDVLHVIGRRQPGLEIIFAPCRVQGEGAAAEIAAAIRLLNAWAAAGPPETHALDLILVTRGGGSLEDLWAFNEEVVARAIFESAVPVVSAVGHEIDFTISDFVADVRAATPSAAAEIITEGAVAARDQVRAAPQRLRAALQRGLEAAREDLGEMLARLRRAHPRRRLREAWQRLDDAAQALRRAGLQHLRERRARWQTLAERLNRVRPALVLARRRERVANALSRLRERMRQRLERRRTHWNALQARLRLLGPEQVLARGYSITLDEATGAVLRDARAVRPGQRLRTRLKTGEILSRAEETHEHREPKVEDGTAGRSA
jgi:exodeoxyribonuclease VII large subunit